MNVMVFNKKEIFKFIMISAIVISACIGSKDYVKNVFSELSIQNEKSPENFFESNGNNEIALTFEIDAEDAGLDILLAILKDRNVKATFFVLGSWASDNPEKLKKIVEEGHSIGNHTMTHQNVLDMSTGNFNDEIKACHDIVKSITGYEMQLFKFTYNNYDNKSINNLIQYDYIPVGASVITDDVSDISKEEILNNIKNSNNLKSGAIIEFNLGSKNGLNSINDVINFLESEKYTFVKLDETMFNVEK